VRPNLVPDQFDAETLAAAIQRHPTTGAPPARLFPAANAKPT
jgi:hypothetical protein